MTYPLAGETIARTLRNVEFGTARPLDEPAPAELAALFEAWRAAEDDEDQAYLAYEPASYSRRLFQVWLETQHRSSLAYNALAKAVKAHRHRCFVTSTHRFWWAVDTEGCRREYVAREPLR